MNTSHPEPEQVYCADCGCYLAMGGEGDRSRSRSCPVCSLREEVNQLRSVIEGGDSRDSL